jgi:hypothetical protein
MFARGRGMLACAVTIAMTASTVVATAAPASAAAGPHDVVTASFRAYTDALTPDETVFYPSGFLLVGSALNESGNKRTSRIYVAYDINPGYAPRLQSAVVIARESYVPDCSTARSLKVQRTAPFTPANTWANPPAVIGGPVSVSEQAACPAFRLTWDVTKAMSSALKQGESRLWLEMQVGANREGDVAFGRLLDANEFQLEITLTNSAPDVPTRLRVWNVEITCSADFTVNQSFDAMAWLTDRDRNPGDLLTGDIEYWNVSSPGTKFPIQTYQGSGGDGVFAFGTIPASTLADGEYAWHARAYDQRAYSGWSVDCPFRVDRTAPALAPTVSSPEYPENPPNPTGGGEGTFLFTANGQADVVEFFYGDRPFSLWNRVPADQTGGAATIQYYPQDTGVQTLYVASVDKAGNRSPVRAYTFNVRDLQLYAWSISQTPDPSGSGINVVMHFSTQAGNGIATVRYSVDGGAQQTVPMGADGVVDATIPGLRGGEHRLTYAGLDAQGRALYGDVDTYFYVDDTPEVTSDGVYPLEGAGGGPGVTGVFTVRPLVTANVTNVRYLISGMSQWQSVALQADGTAQISWTPDASGWYALSFQVEYGDGRYSFTFFTSATVL